MISQYWLPAQVVAGRCGRRRPVPTSRPGRCLGSATYRVVFTSSPVASITSADLLRAILVRVPFGTVLLEEVAFRGVLPALLGTDGQRWRWRPVLGASVLFGLFHLFSALCLARCDGLAVHSLFCPAGPVSWAI